jgi:hypothetical protein
MGREARHVPYGRQGCHALLAGCDPHLFLHSSQLITILFSFSPLSSFSSSILFSPLITAHSSPLTGALPTLAEEPEGLEAAGGGSPGPAAGAETGTGAAAAATGGTATSATAPPGTPPQPGQAAPPQLGPSPGEGLGVAQRCNVPALIACMAVCSEGAALCLHSLLVLPCVVKGLLSSTDTQRPYKGPARTADASGSPYAACAASPPPESTIPEPA